MCSGGYDHGTSTGKGQLELDFTWNPFDLIEFGQTYVVLGYGLTERLRYPWILCPPNKQYMIIIIMDYFINLLDSKYLDLATAIGIRQYTESEIYDLFFPQILYNIKIKRTIYNWWSICQYK